MRGGTATGWECDVSGSGRLASREVGQAAKIADTCREKQRGWGRDERRIRVARRCSGCKLGGTEEVGVFRSFGAVIAQLAGDCGDSGRRGYPEGDFCVLRRSVVDNTTLSVESMSGNLFGRGHENRELRCLQQHSAVLTRLWQVQAIAAAGTPLQRYN